MRSYTRELYYNSVDTMWKSLAIVGILSFIYMFFVQCCPRIMNRVTVVVGALALIAFTITVLVYPSQIAPIARWVVFGIAFVFVLILICTLVKYFQTWGINGVYLDLATEFTG